MTKTFVEGRRRPKQLFYSKHNQMKHAVKNKQKLYNKNTITNITEIINLAFKKVPKIETRHRASKF